MEYLFARHYMYDLLRRTFLEEPSIDFLCLVQQCDAITFLLQHFSEDEKFINHYKQCINSLRSNRLDENSEAYQDLHWDFTQLFIGPHNLPASPWESSYKNDHLLFTEITDSVQKIYQQHGFYLAETEYEAPDHIGFELDFVFNLNEKLLNSTVRNSEEMRVNIQIQYQFIEQHLHSFLDEFSQNMHKYALTDFYKNMALVLNEFIQIDLKKLKLLLNKFN